MTNSFPQHCITTAPICTGAFVNKRVMQEETSGKGNITVSHSTIRSMRQKGNVLRERKYSFSLVIIE